MYELAKERSIVDDETFELLLNFNSNFKSNLSELKYLKIISAPSLAGLIKEADYLNLMQTFADKFKNMYIREFTFQIYEDRLDDELLMMLKKYEYIFQQSFTPAELKFNFNMNLYDPRFINAIKCNSSEQLFEILSEEQKRSFELRETFSSNSVPGEFNKLRLTIIKLYARAKEQSGVECLYEKMTKEIANVFNQTFNQMSEEFQKRGIKYFHIYSPYDRF